MGRIQVLRCEDLESTPHSGPGVPRLIHRCSCSLSLFSLSLLHKFKLAASALRSSMAMASPAVAAMAAQFGSLSVCSTSTSSKANLTSSFTGSHSLLSLRRRVQVPLVKRNVTVQAKGGFIPAEHKWMYEGVEKMGPVSLALFRLTVFGMTAISRNSLSPA